MKKRLALLAAALAAAVAIVQLGCGPTGGSTGGSTSGPASDRSAAAPAADHALAQAFERHERNVEVEDRGVVSRVLSDDRSGSRHQRFILRLASGQTVLVAHNIDLARRVEGLERGDTVAFRGEYEWNAAGGVIHWTHHDPAGRHPGGWIQYRGETYQ